MKDTYIFLAIFIVEPEGIAIEFPDLPGCLSCADDMEMAMHHAREAMSLHLYSMEKDGDEIPEPTPMESIAVEDNGFVTMIDAWMPPFREVMKNQTRRRTIKVPVWLDLIAQREGVDYSQLMEIALKKHLGLS